MTGTEIAAIVAAIGLPTIVSKALDVWKARKSGRARREYHANRDQLRRLREAVAERDVEAAWRRRYQEWAAYLLRRLIACGVPREELGDEPHRPEPEE